MPTQKEIDVVAHILYDQDTHNPNLQPMVPLLASKDEIAIERYRRRARQLLEAAELARQS